MARISRVRLALTGFAGSPGVITWYGLDGPALASTMQNWFNDFRPYLPTAVTGQVEVGGDIIEATDGSLQSSWVGGGTAVLTGNSAYVYSAASGVAVNWLTAIVADGSRIRGRSFVVPLASNAYDLTGSIEATALTAIRASSATAVVGGANNFVVWHRPYPGRAASPTLPARPAHVGSFAFVTASSVADKVAVLRSRRD